MSKVQLYRVTSSSHVEEYDHLGTNLSDISSSMFDSFFLDQFFGLIYIVVISQACQSS
jgi:hypothetical protein